MQTTKLDFEDVLALARDAAFLIQTLRGYLSRHGISLDPQTESRADTWEIAARGAMRDSQGTKAEPY